MGMKREMRLAGMVTQNRRRMFPEVSELIANKAAPATGAVQSERTNLEGRSHDDGEAEAGSAELPEAGGERGGCGGASGKFEYAGSGTRQSRRARAQPVACGSELSPPVSRTATEDDFVSVGRCGCGQSRPGWARAVGELGEIQQAQQGLSAALCVSSHLGAGSGCEACGACA